MFMVGSAMFAAFGWVLFAAYFDLKVNIGEEKIVEEKMYPLEMDKENPMIETERTQ